MPMQSPSEFAHQHSTFTHAQYKLAKSHKTLTKKSQLFHNMEVNYQAYNKKLNSQRKKRAILYA